MTETDIDIIKKAIDQPDDKVFKVRVDVTMELTKFEFVMFIALRSIVKDILRDEKGIKENLDTEFFKIVFLSGAHDMWHEIERKSYERMGHQMVLKILEEMKRKKEE